MAYQPPPPPPPPLTYQPQLPFAPYQPQLPYGSAPTYVPPTLYRPPYQPQLPFGPSAAPTYTPPLTAQQLGFDFRPTTNVQGPQLTGRAGVGRAIQQGTAARGATQAGASAAASAPQGFAQRALAQVRGASKMGLGKRTLLGGAIALGTGFAASQLEGEGDQEGGLREYGLDLLKGAGAGAALGAAVGGGPGALIGGLGGTGLAATTRILQETGIIGSPSSEPETNRVAERDEAFVNTIVRAASEVGLPYTDRRDFVGEEEDSSPADFLPNLVGGSKTGRPFEQGRDVRQLASERNDSYVSDRIFDYYGMVDDGIKPKKALAATVNAIQVEGQRRFDQEQGLAVQAMAARILGPLTKNVLETGEEQAQLQHALADTLPPEYQAWAHAQAQDRITTSTNLAAAYTAQIQGMPAMQQLMDQQARDDQIAQMVWQSQFQQQPGSGGTENFEDLVREFGG